MAFSPCAVHGGMYRGGASTFFLRLIEGAESTGGKVSACANCATLLLDSLNSRFTKVSEGDTFYKMPLEAKCANCGSETDETGAKLYGNAYVRGRAESQWFGYICPNCVQAVIEDLHLEAAR